MSRNPARPHPLPAACGALAWLPGRRVAGTARISISSQPGPRPALNLAVLGATALPAPRRQCGLPHCLACGFRLGNQSPPALWREQAWNQGTMGRAGPAGPRAPNHLGEYSFWCLAQPVPAGFSSPAEWARPGKDHSAAISQGWLGEGRGLASFPSTLYKPGTGGLIICCSHPEFIFMPYFIYKNPSPSAHTHPVPRRDQTHSSCWEGKPLF